MRYLLVFIYMFFFNALTHEYEKDGIKIVRPVLKVVSSKGKVGAGYFTIINNSKKKIKLLGVAYNIAKKQEIHEVILKNNIYKMRPVKKAIVIMPEEKLAFEAKSYHVMFFDINNNIKNKDMLDAYLNFNNDLVINIKFKILMKDDTSHHH